MLMRFEIIVFGHPVADILKFWFLRICGNQFKLIMRCVQLELKQRHLATAFVQPFDRSNASVVYAKIFLSIFWHIFFQRKMIREENSGLLRTKIGYNELTNVTNNCCSIWIDTAVHIAFNAKIQCYWRDIYPHFMWYSKPTEQWIFLSWIIWCACKQNCVKKR